MVGTIITAIVTGGIITTATTAGIIIIVPTGTTITTTASIDLPTGIALGPPDGPCGAGILCGILQRDQCKPPCNSCRDLPFGVAAVALPYAAIEIGEPRHGLARDGAHGVAELHACAFRRATRRETLDRDAVFRFGGIDAEPRPRWTVRAAESQHVVEDRIDQLARHEHVPLHRFVAVRLLHEQ